MPLKDPFLLLRKLADGRFHSGQDLARQLNVSRTSIWKDLRKISQDYGMAIEAVTGRGYRLSQPLTLLNAGQLNQALGQHAQQCIASIEIYPSLDSTNRHLYRLAARGMKDHQVVLAEHQTQGQGRRGREWCSPFAKNIYMSLLWQFDCGPAELAGLSLVVAVAICRALEHKASILPQLKWPNDILCQGRKLGGILLEVQGEAAGPCSVVIGLGLNVTMSEMGESDINQPWIDLKSAGAAELDRNILSASILDELVVALEQFSLNGLTDFLPDWQRWDWIRDESIQLIFTNHVLEGTARGVDENGALLVEQNDEIKAYQTGEVSLRVAG